MSNSVRRKGLPQTSAKRRLLLDAFEDAVRDQDSHSADSGYLGKKEGARLSLAVGEAYNAVLAELEKLERVLEAAKGVRQCHGWGQGAWETFDSPEEQEMVKALSAIGETW